jgi:hypothetical protein
MSGLFCQNNLVLSKPPFHLGTSLCLENGVSMRRSLLSRVDSSFFPFLRVLLLLFGCDVCCSPPCFYTHFV